jgi:hypothetical protein
MNVVGQSKAQDAGQPIEDMLIPGPKVREGIPENAWYYGVDLECPPKAHVLKACPQLGAIGKWWNL